MYASLESYKSDLNNEALNLIWLLGLYLSLALTDWLWTPIHFLVINLGTLSDVVPKRFVISDIPF